jgi:hypothetical protein
MPNRMLRDWTGSDKVNSLSPAAERFFTRLIMKADDYGCFYADSRLLIANLFPLLLKTTRESDVNKWLTECEKTGLVLIYENSGKKYVQIYDFRQRLDKARSKYPLPTSGNSLTSSNETPAEVEVEKEVEQKKNTAPAARTSPGDKEERIEFPIGWNQAFTEQWDIWKKYKLEQFKFKYKSVKSESAGINELFTLSAKNTSTAMAIIAQSMANTWRGLFKLKNIQEIGTSVQNAAPTVPKIDKIVQEINYLYERYLEDKCTIISIDCLHWEFLKKQKLINFSKEQFGAIQNKAINHLAEKGISTTDEAMKPILQKIGVLEFFEQHKILKHKIIFDAA